jgi:predicted nucleotidyltransferase component of viral defense system
MNQQELDKLARTLKISRNQILREEAEMEILDALSRSKISARLVFYGGTALRLAYNSPRFSEDIDLLRVGTLNFSDFKKFVLKTVGERPNWKTKDIKDKRKTMFALVSIEDEKLKKPFSIKIEVHKPARKIELENELKLIKSPASFAEPLLLVPTLSELKKLKSEALDKREKARDIFDLWYISQLSREPFSPRGKTKLSKREFQNELRVFLPPKYYPIIDQLYEQAGRKN